MRYEARRLPIYWNQWVVVDTRTGRRYPMSSAEAANRAATALEQYGVGSEASTRALYQGGCLSAADLVELSGRAAGDVYRMISEWEGDHEV